MKINTKNIAIPYWAEHPSTSKIIKIMKLMVLLMLVALLQVSAKSYSQITLKEKNASIEKIFKKIEQQTDYVFFFRGELNKVALNVNLYDVSINEALDICFKDLPLSYKIIDKTIVVNRQAPARVASNPSIQQTEVRGRVIDSVGNELIGVTVKVKGSNITAITNGTGNFTLRDVEEDAVLTFSYIGFISKEIRADEDLRSVVLSPIESVLDEVVVVGFGVQKKVNLTGSLSTISKEDIAQRKVGQSSMLLQGMAPGVTVTQRSGRPGGDGGNIRIRGIGTLGDASPLILVDGVQMDMDNIDPSVIESITILKDAASSAIYGSRAANGVILVTTKRAVTDQFSTAFNHYSGWQERTNVRNPVGAIDHMTLLDEAYTNTGSAPVFGKNYIKEYAENMATNPDYFPNLNWQDEIYTRNGFQQNYFLTVNGGTDRLKTLANFGYFKQDGLIANADYQRYTIRLNTDLKLTEKLTAKFDMFLRQMEDNTPGAGLYNVIYWANRMPATQPNMLTNGMRGIGWDGDNPAAMAEESGFNKDLTRSVLPTLNINYKIIEGLEAEANLAMHYINKDVGAFRNTVTTNYPDGTVAYVKPARNSLTETRNQSVYTDSKMLLRYTKQFEKNTISALVAGTYENYSSDYITGSRNSFLFPDYTKLNAGSEEEQRASGTGAEWALASYFGRINYDYDSKYLVEVNVRRDGSSRFLKENRWGTFPSFSLGWRLSEEPFWEGLRSHVSNAKVRASYGSLGNQLIGNYPFASFVDIGSYIFGNKPTVAGSIGVLGNSLISWEETRMANLGLDLMLFDKLSLTADYYQKKTTGILLQLYIPLSLGLAPPTQNVGVVENKGWELGLSYRDRIGGFQHNWAFNISDVNNKILDMRGVHQTGLTVNHEGYPINSLFGYEAIGYIKETDFDGDGKYTGPAQFGTVAPGDIKYNDLSGDGVITTADQVVIGSTVPRFTYGLNADFSYKGFDMGMFWQGVGKADGYLNQQSTMPFYVGGTAMEMHKDRWTPTNTDASFPRLTFNQNNNTQNSSFWLKDASYLRLKNVQIGYRIPKSILSKVGLNSLRFYVSGQNLLSVDDFWDGYDVEAPVGDGAFYPQVKLYSVGLDLTF